MWHRTSLNFSCKTSDINIHSTHVASLILFEFPALQMNIGKVCSVLSVPMTGTSMEQSSPNNVLLRVVYSARKRCLTECVCSIFFTFLSPLTDALWICSVSDYICQDGGLFAEHRRVRIATHDRQLQRCVDCHFLLCDLKWSFLG